MRQTHFSPELISFRSDHTSLAVLISKQKHSAEKLLKRFIYFFSVQTQTAQQYSKHVFIEKRELKNATNRIISK